MKIAFFVIYSVIILFVSCEKKENTNISVPNDFHTNLEYGNTAETIEAETIEYRNNEQIHNTENIYPEKPIVIEIDGEARFLEFPNSIKLSIDEYIVRTSFRAIKVYDNASKEANYVVIHDAFGVLLFSLPEIEDWFYLYTPDIHGFVNIYDHPLSITTIYDNGERKILERLPNVRRYGPLLEIHYNNNIKRIWDYYDDITRHRSYRVLDYYEGYDEIFIRRDGSGHDEAFFIYNMQLDTISEIGGSHGQLFYNSSRDMAFCFYQKFGFYFFVYRIKDGIYEKIDEILFQDNYNIYVTTGKWINDNEFEIELIEIYERENTGYIKGVIIGRKNGLTFDLIYSE